ncbi:MAG: heme ABC exporter ATP-binding protein CcmA [Deltaproteobacteria bacterium]|nr:heme ABC exporter ATP-binding protein CcmA [Deltaproteobacteria bacterium]
MTEYQAAVDLRKRTVILRLTVNQLGKAYGFLWALKDVTLDLSAGECVALLGPNGAGKSTLLRILTGLIAPSTGTLYFDGEVSNGHTANLRRRIGMLAPADHLYENLTVKENLSFFTRLYDRDNSGSTLDAALSEVGLAQRSDEFVANLSAGMKCRLSIAKWRLLDPGLLLLDEPYGVLDGSGVDLLEAFLREQCAKGHIVIMASHHVSRVLRLCNRALILHQGRLTFNEAKQMPWPSFDRAFGAFLPQGDP